MTENNGEGKMNEGKIGQRVRLVSTSKHDSSVKCGDTGTIWHIVPSNGTRRVKWDDGGWLDLNPEEDEWELLA